MEKLQVKSERYEGISSSVFRLQISGAEHGKSLAGDQQVVVAPPLCLNPLEVAIPLFRRSAPLPSSHQEAIFWDGSETGIGQVKILCFVQLSVVFAKVIIYVSVMILI